MKCLDCQGQLKVTHSHTSGASRAARAVCEGCGGVFTLATTVLRGEKRGTGAKALSKRLKNGTARIRLEDDGEAVQDADVFTPDEPASEVVS